MLNNINMNNNIIKKIKEKITKKDQDIKSAYEKMTKRHNILYVLAVFIVIFGFIFSGLLKKFYSQEVQQSFYIFIIIEEILSVFLLFYLSFKETKMNKKIFKQELCLINFLKQNNVTFNKEEKEYFLEYVKDKNISLNSNIFNFLERLERNNNAEMEKEKKKLLKSSHIDMQCNFLETK